MGLTNVPISALAAEVAIGLVGAAALQYSACRRWRRYLAIRYPVATEQWYALPTLKRIRIKRSIVRGAPVPEANDVRGLVLIELSQRVAKAVAFRRRRRTRRQRYAGLGTLVYFVGVTVALFAFGVGIAGVAMVSFVLGLYVSWIVRVVRYPGVIRRLAISGAAIESALIEAGATPASIRAQVLEQTISTPTRARKARTAAAKRGDVGRRIAGWALFVVLLVLALVVESWGYGQAHQTSAPMAHPHR